MEAARPAFGSRSAPTFRLAATVIRLNSSRVSGTNRIPSRAKVHGLAPVISRPSSHTRPELGLCRPATARRRELLPAPLAPTTPKHCPAPTLRLNRSTAGSRPYSMHRSAIFNLATWLMTPALAQLRHRPQAPQGD